MENRVISIRIETRGAKPDHMTHNVLQYSALAAIIFNMCVLHVCGDSLSQHVLLFCD